MADHRVTVDVDELRPVGFNVAVQQGDRLSIIVGFYDDGVPVPVAGWTVHAQMRATYGGLLLATFDIADGAPLAAHEVAATLTGAETWDAGAGRWPWDLVVADGVGWAPQTRVAGAVDVVPRATEVA